MDSIRNYINSKTCGQSCSHSVSTLHNSGRSIMTSTLDGSQIFKVAHFQNHKKPRENVQWLKLVTKTCFFNDYYPLLYFNICSIDCFSIYFSFIHSFICKFVPFLFIYLFIHSYLELSQAINFGVMCRSTVVVNKLRISEVEVGSM